VLAGGRGRSGRSGLNEGWRRTGAVSRMGAPGWPASGDAGAGSAVAADSGLAWAGLGSVGAGGSWRSGVGSAAACTTRGAGSTTAGGGATGFSPEGAAGDSDASCSPSSFFRGATFLGLSDSTSPSAFFFGAAFLVRGLPDLARSLSKAGRILSTQSLSMGERTERTSNPASFKCFRTDSLAISNSVATSVIRVLLTKPHSR
jgi:hypothetical protein